MSCNFDPAVNCEAECVVQIDGRFFLLVEIESDVLPTLDRVVVIEITAAQFAALRARGVPLCPIVTTVPTAVAGVTVTLVCTFIVGNQAFIVFDVENAAETVDRLVLVRSPLCPIL